MATWRFREALDGIAAGTMIAASAALIFATFAGRTPASSDPPGQSGSTPSAPVLLGETPVKGSRSARVAIIEFSDFLCPHCGAFANDTLPKLTKKYIAPGRVLVAFRHLPLTRLHPLAANAAAGAECARQQGMFWEMHDLLFRRQPELTESGLVESARLLGLDLTQFASCQGGSGQTRVADDLGAAQALGIRAVPTFLIGSIMDDGRVKVLRGLSGAQPFEAFSGALDAVLAAVESGGQ